MKKSFKTTRLRCTTSWQAEDLFSLPAKAYSDLSEKDWYSQ